MAGTIAPILRAVRSKREFVITYTDNHATQIYKSSKRAVEFNVSRYPARTYGERIRKARLEMGLRQVDLAKLLGLIR